jgi:nicotinate dehydrogenase subunit B
VTGKFEFVHNVRLPGMLHGRVVRPPSIGATVASVDESSVAGMPGVVKIVVKKNFIGVVAEKPWQAIQAATKLKVTWTPGPPLPDSATFHDSLRKLPARDTLMVDSGDVHAKLSGATVLKATYLHPYQMHGSMGSSCAVADVQGDRATIYSATQAVWYQKSTSAMILGLKPENVHVIFRRGSGCYGVNGADTVTYDAAILSRAVGKPVRVQLTRKDEMAFENYGPAYIIDQGASLDPSGNITAWDHQSWSPGLGNRPGTNRPGNIITGYLLGFPPADFAPRSSGPVPARVNNNSNAVPSYFAAVTGIVQSGRVLTHAVESRFFTGPLRSPARLQNTFAHESFIDELAAQVKADPVEYRLRHLRDARLKEVLSTAAKTANWETRPSPKPGNRRTGIASGRGAASVLYEGDNGYTALVAEIEVNQDTGKIVVKRMVAASDVGPISNPDGLRNQVEGGALQGLSRCLGEEVTWDNEKITSVDWRTYHSLPLGFEVPKIEAVLINRTEGEVMGAGETSITLVAAAIGNAIFDATGARIRQVPFTAERIKAALGARG